MKITFIASHIQANELGKYYKQIHDELVAMKHNVFTGNLFSADKDKNLTDKEQREKWYKIVIQNIKESDVVFIEMSYPSTANVGHILTYALDMSKPVVALYYSGRDPFFLRGRIDDRLTLLEYGDNDVKSVVDSALDYVSSVQDVRFNFFISPQIGNYLDWVAKKKRVPRAVYLRRLIENEMKENKEYAQET